MEAARLAQAAGRPVQVAWTPGGGSSSSTPSIRQRWCASRLGVDANGPPHAVGLPGIRSRRAWERGVLRRAHRRVRVHAAGAAARESRTGLHPFSVGPWRAPGANTNRSRPSRISTPPTAAGVDPLEFRLRKHQGPAHAERPARSRRAVGMSPGAAPRRRVRPGARARGVHHRRAPTWRKLLRNGS